MEARRLVICLVLFFFPIASTDKEEGKGPNIFSIYERIESVVPLLEEA